MVPTIEGEFARKRRMMSHGWPIMLRGGMLSPRGYDPVYALMIVSHRLLRYASPFLHGGGAGRRDRVAGAGAGVRGYLPPRSRPAGAGGVGGRGYPRPPTAGGAYYVLTTASLAAGLWDWLAHGTHAGWEPAEGTR